jgi:hypothetical protein
MAQAFSAAGTPVSVQFVVPSYGNPLSKNPAIVMADDGSFFVVVWVGPDNDFTGWNVCGRMYTANGIPMGDQFRISALADAACYTPSVGIRRYTRDFVVVWSEYYNISTNNPGVRVYGQRFNSSATKQGGQFQISPNTGADSSYGWFHKYHPDVDVADNGDFVVVWDDDWRSGQSTFLIYGIRFNASGSQLGNEFQICQNPSMMDSDDYMMPRVSVAADGRFVVAWHKYQDASGFGVYARCFNAGGGATTNEFIVNQHQTSYQYYPDVGCDRAGNFTIAWHSYNNPDDPITTDYGIIARQFNAAGGATTDEYCVNNPYLSHRGIGHQYNPAVDRKCGSGRWVTAWWGYRGGAPSGGILGIWHAENAGNPLPAVTWALSAPTSGTYGQGTLITGDWTGKHWKSAGFYEPTTSSFFLRNSNTSGRADIGLSYGPGNWKPIAGDWTNKGYDSIGLYNPANATFYLRNSNTSGVADTSFGYGGAGNNWTPIAGDWTNKGYDSIGLYNPATSTWYLRNSNTGGVADITFIFGTPNVGWLPIIGDWNGDGVDTVGLYDPATSTFHLRNSNSAGGDDITFVFGTPSSWKPVAGDWNEKGYDSVGLYDYSTATFHLRNSNSAGSDDISYLYRCAIRIAWDGYGMQNGYTVCLGVAPGTDFTNVRWVSIGAIPAINGGDMWYWDRCDTNGTPIPAGTWYVCGYVWDGANPHYNHASTSFVIS